MTDLQDTEYLFPLGLPKELNNKEQVIEKDFFYFICLKCSAHVHAQGTDAQLNSVSLQVHSEFMPSKRTDVSPHSSLICLCYRL